MPQTCPRLSSAFAGPRAPLREHVCGRGSAIARAATPRRRAYALSPTRFRSKGSSEGGCPVCRTPGIFEAVQSRRAPRCLSAFWTCASVEVLPGALRGRQQPSHTIPLVPARTIRSFEKARGRARERLPTRVSREHWPRSLAPIFHFHRSRRRSARSTSSFLVLDDLPVRFVEEAEHLVVFLPSGRAQMSRCSPGH